jgi:hypothetical protein
MIFAMSPRLPPFLSHCDGSSANFASTSTTSRHSSGHTGRSTAAAELVSMNAQRARTFGFNTSGSSKVCVPNIDGQPLMNRCDPCCPISRNQPAASRGIAATCARVANVDAKVDPGPGRRVITASAASAGSA